MKIALFTYRLRTHPGNGPWELCSNLTEGW